MEKLHRARYTLEYKLEALRLIGAGQSVAAVAAMLGLADQTLHSWVKAQHEGRLHGPGAKPVSAEQIELAIVKKSGGVLRAGIGVKYTWLNRHCRHWPLLVMCKQLGVSVNG
jgi:transposase-like protein